MWLVTNTQKIMLNDEYSQVVYVQALQEETMLTGVNNYNIIHNILTRSLDSQRLPNMLWVINTILGKSSIGALIKDFLSQLGSYWNQRSDPFWSPWGRLFPKKIVFSFNETLCFHVSSHLLWAWQTWGTNGSVITENNSLEQFQTNTQWLNRARQHGKNIEQHKSKEKPLSSPAVWEIKMLLCRV